MFVHCFRQLYLPWNPPRFPSRFIITMCTMVHGWRSTALGSDLRIKFRAVQHAHTFTCPPISPILILYLSLVSMCCPSLPWTCGGSFCLSSAGAWISLSPTVCSSSMAATAAPTSDSPCKDSVVCYMGRMPGEVLLQGNSSVNDDVPVAWIPFQIPPLD